MRTPSQESVEIKLNSEDESEYSEKNNSCRICYEDDKQHTMIAPCLCSGDLKYIHRKCLDEYRALSISNPAFTRCNTCNFDYIIEIENDHGCCKSPHTEFRMRVIFDILKVAFCWFGLVSLCAFILRVTGMKDTLIHAYLWGLAIVFGIMGIIGSIHGIYKLITKNNDESNAYGRRRSRNRYQHDNDCCGGCYWYPVTCFHGGGGGSCDCGGCDGGSEGCAICAVILLVLAIILIIIGAFYAIIVSAIVISQMAATHYTKLNARLMTKEYVVKNLEKYSKEKIMKMKTEQYPIPSAPDANLMGPSPKEQKQITIM